MNAAAFQLVPKIEKENGEHKILSSYIFLITIAVCLIFSLFLHFLLKLDKLKIKLFGIMLIFEILFII